MEDLPDVEMLVSSLMSESESSRKYAVFKLQGLLSDPSFADAFIQGDGLLALRDAVMQTSGNTQAYALGSLDKLLELDMGWDGVDVLVIEKAVALAVSQPLVNIVRNALTLLVLVVSRPLTGSQKENGGAFGFRAIKPALDNHPTFLESLVHRLSASDHTLCANALQLVNALMRDAVMHGGEHEWPRFIKRLQDLGVIGGVGMLMRGDAANDAGSPLAAAILEFQGLTKLLLRKWKEVRVNVELHEHKKALKTIHLLSNPEPYRPADSNGETGRKGRAKHHPEKWRRLGFETGSPAWEFDETGYLGMMDLVDFARRNEDTYQKILMEQSVHPAPHRCPLARASLSVTLILYEHFEIDESANEEGSGHRNSLQERIREARANGNLDRLYRPLLLQWGRLHTAAINAFVRIWKASGAVIDDFYKIEEVVRIIVERVVGTTIRKTEVGKVEDELRSVSLEEARKWQMEGLDEVYEDAWGPHLVQIREQLHHESLQFMKEQRIRCLLQGSWFPAGVGVDAGWRFVRLSHNRRHLHYRSYPAKGDDEPGLSDLPEKLDLHSVTSVDSNVSASEQPATSLSKGGGGDNSSTETLTEKHHDSLNPTPTPTTNTKITIIGHPPLTKSYKLTPVHTHTEPVESVLLELYPQSSSLASEWLDGLLMLLSQQPITKETIRCVDVMEDWGVRLRMLNLRWEDVDWEALEMGAKGERVEVREVPGREGLGEDYWYDLPET
ncbi:hypothetical protein LTR37_014075 [Vermiconidia calcicola]|uniref:Uncharacterized protein n=1 Tax=Vermiconidia calcicola TaxID=1690605 RepID=A0ACC3MUG0_9PEZI|nr:hypothetical protein LTR37_014075 [Vermiconidia calcicola]